MEDRSPELRKDMHGLERIQIDLHRILAFGVAAVYVAITSAVPLMHSDDCPQADGKSPADSSAPCDAPCPACKFLGNSNATAEPCESAPVLTSSSLIAAPLPEVQIVLTCQCPGPIIRRAPPDALDS